MLLGLGHLAASDGDQPWPELPGKGCTLNLCLQKQGLCTGHSTELLTMRVKPEAIFIQTEEKLLVTETGQTGRLT